MKTTLEDLYDSIEAYYSILLNYEVELMDLDLSNYNDIISYIRKSGTEKVYRLYLQSKIKKSLLLAQVILKNKL